MMYEDGFPSHKCYILTNSSNLKQVYSTIWFKFNNKFIKSIPIALLILKEKVCCTTPVQPAPSAHH